MPPGDVIEAWPSFRMKVCSRVKLRVEGDAARDVVGISLQPEFEPPHPAPSTRQGIEAATAARATSRVMVM